MANTVISKKEAEKVMDFICETKEGKYTAEKLDLFYITYARLEMQEGDTSNIFDDCYEDTILYGLFY